jgi:uncharacterized membrane protein YqjE
MDRDDNRPDSITHTLGRLIDDVRELFREEVALARAELRHEVSSFTGAAARMGVGAAAGAFAVAFLLLGVAQGVAALVGWPVWAGYLTMGIVLAIAAAIALQSGRKRVQNTAVLPQTTETLRETREWMKDRMSSADR